MISSCPMPIQASSIVPFVLLFNVDLIKEQSQNILQELLRGSSNNRRHGLKVANLRPISRHLKTADTPHLSKGKGKQLMLLYCHPYIVWLAWLTRFTNPCWMFFHMQLLGLQNSISYLMSSMGVMILMGMLATKCWKILLFSNLPPQLDNKRRYLIHLLHVFTHLKKWYKVHLATPLLQILKIASECLRTLSLVLEFL